MDFPNNISLIFYNRLTIFQSIRLFLFGGDDIEGIIKGRLSQHQIYYTDLMYNKPNWRDAVKSKSTSRNEAISEHENLMIEQNDAYSDYQEKKIRNNL